MKEIVFDRKKYNSYKDMYEDLAVKLDRVNGLEDYYNIHNYDYDPHCLDEDLEYGFDNNKQCLFIFKNFDKDKIKLQKNYDDYEYSMIIEIFENFVKKHPNNKLEFVIEE